MLVLYGVAVAGVVGLVPLAVVGYVVGSVLEVRAIVQEGRAS